MDMVFARRGSGPPLVVLCGTGPRARAWEPVIGLLAAEREVHAATVPAGDLDAAVTALAFAVAGLDRPHVAGWGFGGLVALEAAERGLVSSATAFAPTGFDSADRPSTLLTALRRCASVPGMLLERLVAPPVKGSLPYRAGFGGPLLAPDDGSAFTGDLADVPVTLAWGTLPDGGVPSPARSARARLPHVTHLRLPGCGRVPMADAPRMVAEVILTATAAAERQRVAVAG
ncbi:alpha/beta fold hydrolase [Actinocorallia sp. A-T 12471]|uniref:alpha/beta fold hydrolase n=1 Tax=Actinocorallia sp. A-T 12471 TaxID=3089813 RepID=UPI0029CC6CC2|nr:alpha/beta fold hydrolase [Actinocorallia sp. A-T 12471]MDX6742510.1 alpha/beta hydrolase [Actinocorallia sp. A-T 12471]